MLLAPYTSVRPQVSEERPQDGDTAELLKVNYREIEMTSVVKASQAWECSFTSERSHHWNVSVSCVCLFIRLCDYCLMTAVMCSPMWCDVLCLTGVCALFKVWSLKLEQEVEKNKILSEALKNLATEHHELEKSLNRGRTSPTLSTLTEDDFYDAVSGEWPQHLRVHPPSPTMETTFAGVPWKRCHWLNHWFFCSPQTVIFIYFIKTLYSLILILLSVSPYSEWCTVFLPFRHHVTF